ncbi:MAG: RNA 3'-terminal phosphate cyclase [Methanosarcinales archaeon]|nr:RNA 3'-terminal phosphate cyclase [Methanosarcinales archaeon]
MIEIDGSHGEGGGQIVRTATALSAVTGKPVRITRIRQGRPRPGLAHQHVKAILGLALISGASTRGVFVGSTEVTFEPGEIQGGSYEMDIGTAGSITLLIQCLLPALARAGGPVKVAVQGGTDVKWCPTIDYLEQVALPAFGLFGVDCRLTVEQRGYYPRGGGRAVVEVLPGPLRPAAIDRLDLPIRGVSHCSNLPEHVARRQADAALETLEAAGFSAEIEVQVAKAPSTGSGITLWSGHKGASALGERGLRAEAVGSSAAKDLIQELKCRSSVDVHLADQLVPYLALAGGSCSTREISSHTRTNLWTASQFLDFEMAITGDEVFQITGKPGPS